MFSLFLIICIASVANWFCTLDDLLFSDLFHSSLFHNQNEHTYLPLQLCFTIQPRINYSNGVFSFVMNFSLVCWKSLRLLELTRFSSHLLLLLLLFWSAALFLFSINLILYSRPILIFDYFLLDLGISNCADAFDSSLSTETWCRCSCSCCIASMLLQIVHCHVCGRLLFRQSLLGVSWVVDLCRAFEICVLWLAVRGLFNLSKFSSHLLFVFFFFQLNCIASLSNWTDFCVLYGSWFYFPFGWIKS